MEIILVIVIHLSSGESYETGVAIYDDAGDCEAEAMRLRADLVADGRIQVYCDPTTPD
jgi:hypothetical protein